MGAEKYMACFSKNSPLFVLRIPTACRHATLQRISGLILIGAALSACAAPPALTLASLTLDNLSYMATGKSLSDHALSTIADRDCALGNLIKGETICPRAVIPGRVQAAALANPPHKTTGRHLSPPAPAPTPTATPWGVSASSPSLPSKHHPATPDDAAFNGAAFDDDGAPAEFFDFTHDTIPAPLDMTPPLPAALPATADAPITAPWRVGPPRRGHGVFRSQSAG